MSDFSTQRESKTASNITSGGVYVSLHTADEGQTPGGGNEVSAADYSRLNIAAADLNTSGSAPTTISNANVEEWTASAQNDWGNVTHFAFWDDTAANNGDPETATVSFSSGGGDITAGERVYVEAGQLEIQID